MPRGTEVQSYETLPRWHAGLAEHEFQIHRVQFQPSRAATQLSSCPEIISLQTLWLPPTREQHNTSYPLRWKTRMLRWWRNGTRTKLFAFWWKQFIAQSYNTVSNHKGNRWTLGNKSEIISFTIISDWLPSVTSIVHDEAVTRSSNYSYHQYLTEFICL